MNKQCKRTGLFICLNCGWLSETRHAKCPNCYGREETHKSQFATQLFRNAHAVIENPQVIHKKGKL